MAKITANNMGLTIPTFGDGNKNIRANLLQKMNVGSHIDSNGVMIFQNVNFQINEGDRVAIFGSNGSGKTSLLRLISKIYTPTSGCLEVKGNVRSLISLGAGIDPNLTGYENIKILCLMTLNGGAVNDDLFEKVAEFSELGDYLNMPVRTYSSGMMLRLISGTIFTYDAEVFVVDEYFAVGDQSFANKVKKHMSSMVEKSKIFVLATHSRELIRDYCNRIFVVDEGNIDEKDIKRF